MGLHVTGHRTHGFARDIAISPAMAWFGLHAAAAKCDPCLIVLLCAWALTANTWISCHDVEIMKAAQSHNLTSAIRRVSSPSEVDEEGLLGGGGGVDPCQLRLASLPTYTPISTHRQPVLISVNVWTLPDPPTSLLPKGVSDNHIPTMSRGLSFHFF